MNWKFLHLFFEAGCIKIHYVLWLEDLCILMQGKVYKNQISSWISNFGITPLRRGVLKSIITNSNYDWEMSFFGAGRLQIKYVQAGCFMHPAFEEEYIKKDCHRKLKIFAPLLWGGLHKNQLYIMDQRFIHLSFEDGCIKINYHRLLKIFAPYLWGELYQNQLLLWIEI